MIGTLLKFDRAKGIGFAMSDEDPCLPDVLVHFSEIRQSQFWKRRFLLPEMKLEFDLAENPKATCDDDRYRAKNVRVVAPVQIAVQRSTAKPGGAK